MDKRRAIQIMTKAAELYRDNLEDQKVLFLYALPSEIKKEAFEYFGLISHHGLIIHNAPLEYDNLILNGDPENYLKDATE